MERVQRLLGRFADTVRDATGARMAVPPAEGRFVLGIDLGGAGATIRGDRWMGHDEAVTTGVLQAPGAQRLSLPVRPVPYAEPGVRQMLGSLVLRARTLELSVALPPGRYAVRAWFQENYRSHWHQLALSVDGQVVARGLCDLERGQWQCSGPWPTQAPGGRTTLAVDSGRDEIDAILMGLSVHAVG